MSGFLSFYTYNGAFFLTLIPIFIILSSILVKREFKSLLVVGGTFLYAGIIISYLILSDGDTPVKWLNRLPPQELELMNHEIKKTGKPLSINEYYKIKLNYQKKWKKVNY